VHAPWRGRLTQWARLGATVIDHCTGSSSGSGSGGWTGSATCGFTGASQTSARFSFGSAIASRQMPLDGR
jgi:hypothetical protein